MASKKKKTVKEVEVENTEAIETSKVEEAEKEIIKEEEKPTEVKEDKELKKIKKSMEKESAINNKCPACSAPIMFNPKLNKWKCEYCNSEFSLEEMQKYNNASSEENNEKGEDTEDLELVSYKCQNCGAEIVADENTAATFCVYCGSVAILKSKLSGKFAPDSIIPFKKTREEAVKAFESLAKGRPLCPKDFTDKKNIEKIKGVYIPFWLHNITVKGELDSKATRVSTWTTGDYVFTKTDYYELLRDGEVSYIRVPVDGSTNFDNDIMNSVEPFNYDELIKYNHAYLSGFFAEKYDVPTEDTIKEASDRALESTKDIFYEGVAMYNNRYYTKNTLKPIENSTEYALLPVWMVNVKYGNKNYIFAMNAQTGKFIGDIPLDKGKAWRYGILMFIIIAVISYLVFLMFMG